MMLDVLQCQATATKSYEALLSSILMEWCSVEVRYLPSFSTKTEAGGVVLIEKQPLVDKAGYTGAQWIGHHDMWTTSFRRPFDLHRPKENDPLMVVGKTKDGVLWIHHISRAMYLERSGMKESSEERDQKWSAKSMEKDDSRLAHTKYPWPVLYFVTHHVCQGDDPFGAKAIAPSLDSKQFRDCRGKSKLSILLFVAFWQTVNASRFTTSGVVDVFASSKGKARIPMMSWPFVGWMNVCFTRRVGKFLT